MKWYISITLMLCILLSFSFVGYAQENVALNQLEETYKLKSVESCPEGVTPLEFESIEELEKYLKQSKGNKHLEYYISSSKSKQKKKSEFSLMTYSTVSLHEDTNVNYLARFNLWADVEVWAQGSFFEIKSVSYKRVALTGTTLGLRLVDKRTSARISSDRQSVTIKGSGIVETYFIIEGGIKVAEDYVSLTITYGR